MFKDFSFLTFRFSLKVLFIIHFSLICFADKASFDLLKTSYQKNLRRLKFPHKMDIPFRYNKTKSDLQNLDAYGRKLLSEHTNLEHVYWFNAAIVYRAYCSTPVNNLYTLSGQGYQGVILATESGGYIDVQHLTMIDVSAEKPELYLFFGQHSSLLLRMIEKDILFKPRKYVPLTRMFNLLKDNYLSIIFQFYIEEGLQKWYENSFDKRSVGLFNTMSSDYVAKKFKELFTIEFYRETEKAKKESVEDIKTLVSFSLDTQTAKNIGSVYELRTQRLWFVSPPLLRPAIAVLANSYSNLSKGNVRGFVQTRAESLAMFSAAVKKSRDLSSWLDNVEVGVTSPEQTLAPFFEVLNDTEKSDISRYLDEVEKKLENNKE